jgi:hypothetical protein
MCTGQRNFVTALVRLNVKIRGHKAHSVTVSRRAAAVRQISPLALSYFQPDKVCTSPPQGDSLSVTSLSQLFFASSRGGVLVL